MARIILTLDGVTLQDLTLSKERVTIGRRARNDMVLDDIAISAEHAVIVRLADDSYLEDLNSTNGTQVNGQPIRKHFLKDGDLIELANYSIRYVAGTQADNDIVPPLDVGKTSESAVSEHQSRSGQSSTENQTRLAVVRLLNGANAGKEIALTKVLTTVGRPGAQVAVITRGLQGYGITHVEGDTYPIVNGKSIGGTMHLMAYGDVIDLAGTRMEFLAK